MSVLHHTDAESFEEAFENSDTVNGNTHLKGTQNATVGGILTLFGEYDFRDMLVATTERRPAEPAAARITVETFSELQTVFDTLGVATLAATETDGEDGFTVRYVFD